MNASRALRTGTSPDLAPEGTAGVRVLDGSPHEREAHGQAPGFHLTQREREVLDLLSEGLSNKMIGRRLHISSGTVKVHVGNILRKLAVSSRLHAVIVARQRGLVHEHTPAFAPRQILSRRPCED